LVNQYTQQSAIVNSVEGFTYVEKRAVNTAVTDYLPSTVGSYCKLRSYGTMALYKCIIIIIIIIIIINVLSCHSEVRR